MVDEYRYLMASDLYFREPLYHTHNVSLLI